MKEYGSKKINGTVNMMDDCTSTFCLDKGSNLALANLLNASSFFKKSKLKFLSLAIFSKYHLLFPNYAT